MSLLLKKKSTRNLLDYVPKRLVEHEIDPTSGNVTLLLPRFNNRWAKRLFGGLNKSPVVKLRLDKVGSFLWQAMDGQSSLTNLADALMRKFGEQVEPVYQRVAVFARDLQRHGTVALEKPTRNTVLENES